MKRFSYGFTGLAVLCFFLVKPWPQRQLLMLACFLPMWAYMFILAKLLRLKKLTMLKEHKTLIQILGFIVGILGVLCVGAPFAIIVFPWLAQCVDQSTLILPVPIPAIATVILSIPIIFL